MIRLIAIWIIKNRIKEAKSAQKKLDNTIVIQAYGNMIQSFKDTLGYLEAHR